jgi:cell division septation protein DedD
MNVFMVRWLKLSLVAVVGCGFLAMLVYALINRDEIRSSQIEPPLISPPSEALKRRPDQPGGMQIPNRDKLVFDLLDGDMSSSVPSLEPAQGMDGAGLAMNPVTSVNPVNAAPAAAVVTPTLVATPTAQVAVAATVASATAPVPVAKIAEKAAVEKPVEKPQPVVEKKVSGGWGVQLAAVGSKADGEKAVTRLSKDFAALKGLSGHVASTPDGKKHRVQFVGLKSRADAVAVCAKLMPKQPCFPVAIPQ